jgi:hypothetical protein
MSEMKITGKQGHDVVIAAMILFGIFLMAPPFGGRYWEAGREPLTGSPVPQP